MMENQALLAALLPPPSEVEMNQIKVEIGGGNSDKVLIETINPNVQVVEPNLNQEEKCPVMKKITKRKKRDKKSDFMSSVMDQDNDNVIGFFENIDPMLAWAILKSKILPQIGNFDIIAEKAK